MRRGCTLAGSWALATLACGPELGPIELGTYEPSGRPADALAHTPRGLTIEEGELGILEGDDTLVSALGAELGLVISPERNDLAQVTARYAQAFVDRPAVLLLFTTFDDQGAAGPAYYLPFAQALEGVGQAPFDQRATFGVTQLVGVANLKSPAHHQEGQLLPRVLHELAHPALAYLQAIADTSTTPFTLLGRQGAHWHAALHTDGSVLGGHHFQETSPGRFLVLGRNSGYSPLDRYGLGLLAPEAVPPFFFIAEARTEGGASIPNAAELAVGSTVLGRAVPVTIEDVLRAVGPRAPAFPAAPRRLEVVLGLLTAPGESATSSRAQATRELILTLMPRVAERYALETGGVGSLCWRLRGCEPPGPIDPPPVSPKAEAPGCGCRAARAEGSSGPATERAGPMLMLLLVGAGFRRRRPGPSGARWPRPAGPLVRGARRPAR